MHFFVSVSGDHSAFKILSLYLQLFLRYEGSPKIWKVGHVISSGRLWPNFAFLPLVLLVINSHAKFEVSSSNRSCDMAVVPKFEN